MLMKKNKQQTNRIIILFIYLLQKLVERLSTMKLVVSNKTALKKLDSYGVNFDGPLKEMQAMQISTLMQPPSCAISFRTTSLFALDDRAWSISTSRFFGSSLASANILLFIFLEKREYKVEHCFTVWQ